MSVEDPTKRLTWLNGDTPLPIPHHPRVPVRNLPFMLGADVRRVIALPFDITSKAKISAIFECVSTMSEIEVEKKLAKVMNDFSGRHREIRGILGDHFNLADKLVAWPDKLSFARKLLIGAYCTMEYSLASAAIFNPSIVAHPDQSGVTDGGLRFIMSLRAIGEGHISSSVFQTGIIHLDGSISLDQLGRYSARTKIVIDREYLKTLFERKLDEIGVCMDDAQVILSQLNEVFTFRELEKACTRAYKQYRGQHHFENVINSMLWLAKANYQLQLADDNQISDLILFPSSETDARGIEDLRLVKFFDNGDTRYFGTYTAFDGEHILPMLIETKDFRNIDIHTLNGSCVQNKGMAMFPRKVNGHYMMCSRIDGRSMYLMSSDYPHFWESAQLLANPKFPWEFRIMGNCGSPIETDEGWLLITHGVGAMRKYCIGAMLLDLDNPFKIIGRLREPLLSPIGPDRDGYVPNVVYSCGSLVHKGRLLMPYAVSDSATRMASIKLSHLIDQLLRDGD